VEQDSEEWKQAARESGLWDSINNATEWMAIPKHFFDFTGLSCNKIGVYYSAFRNQGSTKCHSTFGT